MQLNTRAKFPTVGGLVQLAVYCRENIDGGDLSVLHWRKLLLERA